MRSQNLHDVADELNAIPTIERALRVSSADPLIPASTPRPHVVDALGRGGPRTPERTPVATPPG